jgi:hypothetical protein
MSRLNFSADYTNVADCPAAVWLDLQHYITHAVAPAPVCGFTLDGTLTDMYVEAPGCVVERGADAAVVWVNTLCECDRHALHVVPDHVLKCRHTITVAARGGAVCYIRVDSPCTRLIFGSH